MLQLHIYVSQAEQKAKRRHVSKFSRWGPIGINSQRLREDRHIDWTFSSRYNTHTPLILHLQHFRQQKGEGNKPKRPSLFRGRANVYIECWKWNEIDDEFAWFISMMNERVLSGREQNQRLTDVCVRDARKRVKPSGRWHLETPETRLPQSPKHSAGSQMHMHTHQPPTLSGFLSVFNIIHAKFHRKKYAAKLGVFKLGSGDQQGTQGTARCPWLKIKTNTN